MSNERCPTCLGYVPDSIYNLSRVKVQTPWGNVEWPVCEDCNGAGTLWEYERLRAKARRRKIETGVGFLALLVIICLVLWSIR